MLPCRRFALPLTEHDARRGAGVTRYVFTVEDLHLLLLVGLPTHYQRPYPVPGFAQVRLVSEAMRSVICISLFQASQHASRMAS